MSNTLGIISPTSIDLANDVRKVLGESSTSASVVCRSAKINKWSKHKPVIYPVPFGLTDSQRIGHSIQMAQGIYYGIKMGTIGGRLADIHNATFDYYPPQGGESQPWRIADFRGYNHNAQPTPIASELTKEIQYQSERAFACRIVHSPGNTTGVSWDDILTAMRQTGLDTFSLANAYPCLMITRKGGTTHAVRALKCYDTGDVTPLYYNGAWHERYYIGLEKGTLGDAAQLLPTTNGSWPLTVSVFLAGVLTGDHFDLHNWCLTNDGNPAWVLPQAVGLYDACGKSATYKVFDDSASGGNESTWRVYVASLTQISTGIRFVINSNLNTAGTTYRLYVNVAGCGSNEKTFTIPQNSSINLDFTWSELRMGPPAPAAGSVYTIGMQIHSMSGVSTTSLWWEGQKIITIQ